MLTLCLQLAFEHQVVISFEVADRLSWTTSRTNPESITETRRNLRECDDVLRNKLF